MKCPLQMIRNEQAACSRAAADTTLAYLRAYTDCAKKMGVIYGSGVYEKEKVTDTSAFREAYEIGKKA